MGIFFYNKYGLSKEMGGQIEPEKWIRTTANVWRLPDPLVFCMRSIFWIKFEYALRRVSKLRSFSVYHETGFVPSAVPELPVVYTIFDLSLIKFRDKHPGERVRFFDFFLKRRIDYVDHVITISEYIKGEVTELLGIEKERITAIPLAPEPLFSPRPPEQVKGVLKTRKWPDDYLLFVGSREPRKNLSSIVRALGLTNNNRMPLIVVGWEGWGDRGWAEEVERNGLRDRIFLAGYVDDETLACLYSGAVALLYPSLYEGFGLPVLEAMACGCPVICSNTSSLPEVSGDAALLVDPQDVEALSDAIDRMIGDTALRQGLRARGFKRAAGFTWEETARQTLEVFKKVAY